MFRLVLVQYGHWNSHQIWIHWQRHDVKVPLWLCGMLHSFCNGFSGEVTTKMIMEKLKMKFACEIGLYVVGSGSEYDGGSHTLIWGRCHHLQSTNDWPNCRQLLYNKIYYKRWNTHTHNESVKPLFNERSSQPPSWFDSFVCFIRLQCQCSGENHSSKCTHGNNVRLRSRNTLLLAIIFWHKFRS